MPNTSISVNKAIHAKLKAISEHRKAAGRYDYSIGAIVSEMTLTQYKKEIKK